MTQNPYFCHMGFFPSGSFATASCLICKYKVDCEVVRGDIFNQVKTYFNSLQLSNK